MGKVEVAQVEAKVAAEKRRGRAPGAEAAAEGGGRRKRSEGGRGPAGRPAARGGRAVAAAPAPCRGRADRGDTPMAPETPLEHKTIEGVAVEGRKTTTVIPAGQVGNEQPITITSEEWRSPELNLLVLTKHSDPRTGESSYRLQNIIRAEPDRSLFMVPPDYTVKETGIRKMEEPRSTDAHEH